MAAERGSVRGVALHWFSARSGHVDSLPPLLSDRDIELYTYTLTHATLDLSRVVLSDRSMVDEHILDSIVGIDESISVFNVTPFKAFDHALTLVTACVEA